MNRNIFVADKEGHEFVCPSGLLNEGDILQDHQKSKCIDLNEAVEIFEG